MSPTCQLPHNRIQNTVHNPITNSRQSSSLSVHFFSVNISGNHFLLRALVVAGKCRRWERAGVQRKVFNGGVSQQQPELWEETDFLSHRHSKIAKCTFSICIWQNLKNLCESLLFLFNNLQDLIIPNLILRNQITNSEQIHAIQKSTLKTTMELEICERPWISKKLSGPIWRRNPRFKED